jgi:hypothetical protein
MGHVTDSSSVSERGNHSKGKPVELFIAAYCMLASKNQLNVSTSFIDDEGVDLVFNRWRHSGTLALQVKSQFADTKEALRGKFVARVKRSTFQARSDYYVLFVNVDEDPVRLGPIWLVPSAVLDKKNQGSAEIEFKANLNTAGEEGVESKWNKYAVVLEELPQLVLSILQKLELIPS